MVTYKPWRCGWVLREQSFSIDGQLALKALEQRGGDNIQQDDVLWDDANEHEP
jgi:hypothetical protein